MSGAKGRGDMNLLQDALIESLLDRIQNGELYVDKNGNEHRRPCSPQVLTAAIRELERHGITVNLRAETKLDGLADAVEEHGPLHKTDAAFPEDLH